MRLWSRIFAWGYDTLTRASERAGMSDIRAGLVAQATGRTLEIGAGTGHNVRHYPPAVTELVLSEPSPFMAGKLRAKLARDATVVEAPAENLPFPDDHFDTVVCTLVLCTVPEPDASVAEIARVLKPGGRLLFVEHVRSSDPKIARRQDRFMRPWRAFGDGCHCNRDTLATLEASPLAVEQVEHGKLPKAPSLVEPLITGSARAA
jgi:ubiquinone/menaquinone biosynthesis C-methylase UbiE